jgi:hypothetical protein
LTSTWAFSFTRHLSLIDHRTNGSDLAEQTGRKAWFTAEEMNQWRAERKMAPWYKRIYRMLFSQ